MDPKEVSLRSQFSRARNRLLRPYLSWTNGASVVTKIMKQQINDGTLPKEFLDFMKEEKREKYRKRMKIYRKPFNVKMRRKRQESRYPHRR